MLVAGETHRKRTEGSQCVRVLCTYLATYIRSTRTASEMEPPALDSHCLSHRSQSGVPSAAFLPGCHHVDFPGTRSFWPSKHVLFATRCSSCPWDNWRPLGTPGVAQCSQV